MATCEMVEAWYRWVDSRQGFVVLDGGLGHMLSVRENDLSTGSMWSGRLLFTKPEEVSNCTLYNTVNIMMLASR